MRELLGFMIAFGLVTGEAQERVCLPKVQYQKMINDLDACADCGDELAKSFEESWDCRKEKKLTEWWQSPLAIIGVGVAGVILGASIMVSTK